MKTISDILKTVYEFVVYVPVNIEPAKMEKAVV